MTELQKGGEDGERRGKEEGESGRSRCSPARGPGRSALGMGFPLPRLPQNLGLRRSLLQALLGWKQPEPWGSEAPADHTPSSQSPLSVSPFQGKAESQGLSVRPRTWSNAQVFPV